ncbi:hypothetical protein ABH940_007412 [Streptacidiphilus sp. BW17]|uniref:hypothetical protein n=1 Tax=Streptacidiphilus sp. BW17 TaxID=3156274 RepID=UPI003517E685
MPLVIPRVVASTVGTLLLWPNGRQGPGGRALEPDCDGERKPPEQREQHLDGQLVAAHALRVRVGVSFRDIVGEDDRR